MNTQFVKSLGWDISSFPVSIVKESGEIITDPNFQTITRNDNDKILSVMSKKYNPMTVKEFEQATERMLDVSGMEFMGYQEFKEGGIILSCLKNQHPLQVNDYPIDDHLILGTSFNGDMPFFVGTSTILVRCQNAFSQIHIMSKARHTKFSPQKREQILCLLEDYIKDRERIYSSFEDMQKKEVSNVVVLDFVNNVLNIPSVLPEKGLATRTINKRDELMSCIEGEMNDLGNNVFGLFNGLTKFTTHSLKTRTEAPFGNLIGTAADLNNKGFALCNELLRAA